MNAVLKILLSMSFSGGLLILILFLGKRFLKNKISRQWQYYIWLAVILRLLFPFDLQINLMGKNYQAMEQAIRPAASSLTQQTTLSTLENNFTSTFHLEQSNKNTIRILLINHIWLVWLVIALGMLIRKVTIYQSFLRYINAGAIPVSDTEILDHLSIIAQQSGIKKPIELCVNPLISSPLLIGFFHVCIVLPSADIQEKEFSYIILHELIHYKRRDMFYKWLVQITVCLHWFNPLVHLMSWEITRACEFSCDEAVLAKIGRDSAQDYGETLLNAMAAVGKYKETLGSTTLNGNKQLLKERLGAIMNFKKRSKTICCLTGMLTLCIIFGAAFIGIYPAAANLPFHKPPESENKNSAQKELTYTKDYASLAERYYEAGSLPLFEIIFPRLDENVQKKWLEKFYAEEDFTFFSVSVCGLDINSSLFTDFAKKAYIDEEIAFFSIMMDGIEEEELEFWLDRALEDENWAFESILFDRLDREDEFDELEEKQEKEWAEAQLAEYQAAGIMMDDKNYYYQNCLVNIFLDIRSDHSFYTLDMNPKGNINIKVLRNENNEITGVSYMTEAEVTKLLEEMLEEEEDLEDKADIKIIPVDLKTVAAGESIYFGEYTLSRGDKISYDISAETGNGIKVFFAKDESKNVAYWSVHNLRQKGEALKCSADMTVELPGKPGIYQLFLCAPDGALENVKGSISIILANES